MRNIAILGATGSIGENAVRVIRSLPETFHLTGVAARSRTGRLAEIAREFRCEYAATADPARYADLAAAVPAGCRAAAGDDALVELATRADVDVVLVAIVGTGGLEPTVAALRAGKTVALASKEVMVMAGELVRREWAVTRGGGILPVDSEHSALFQCLAGRRRDEIARLVLTASGGAFRDWPPEKLAGATAADALRHPVWNMGPRITIDSASLMNKALELVEARYLFDFPPEKLAAVIHPESIVHSMVELTDGAFIAQLSQPDMRFAIQYALAYPERPAGTLPKLDFATGLQLRFHAPDRARYPAFRLADLALRAGGTLPAVMNAADEIAVERFQRGELRFPEITDLIADVMSAHRVEPQRDFETLRVADAAARDAARAWRPPRG